MRSAEDLRELGSALFAGTEATLETLDPTSGVDDLHGAGEERMASRGDLYLVERVGVSVGPLDGLVGLDGGPGEKAVLIGRRILKDYGSVLGVDSSLHKTGKDSGAERRLATS